MHWAAVFSVWGSFVGVVVCVSFWVVYSFFLLLLLQQLRSAGRARVAYSAQLCEVKVIPLYNDNNNNVGFLYAISLYTR